MQLLDNIISDFISLLSDHKQKIANAGHITTENKLYGILLYAFVLSTDFTIEMYRAKSVQYSGPCSRKTDFEKAL